MNESLSHLVKKMADAGTKKGVSRKLLVFFVATFLYVADRMDQEVWVTVAMVYMGSQGLVDAVQAFRKKSDEDSP